MQPALSLAPALRWTLPALTLITEVNSDPADGDFFEIFNHDSSAASSAMCNGVSTTTPSHRRGLTGPVKR